MHENCRKALALCERNEHVEVEQYRTMAKFRSVSVGVRDVPSLHCGIQHPDQHGGAFRCLKTNLIHAS